MIIDPVSPLITDNITSLCAVTVLMFIGNTILNWKSRLEIKSMNKKLSGIEKIAASIENLRIASLRLQESIDNFGEVKNSLDKIKENILEIKSPIQHNADFGKNNEMIVDNVIIPFIDEMRENSKNYYTLLNSISGNLVNVTASLNTVFQGLISTLKK